ncbi:hypothetical protein [Paracoccus sulfuroxidans]|uniref:Uncharacterized protein n=1 Tax=Paracoccus sulfuroxidans TaxID=384678 RepID=A0A562P0X7_9RHOB|nr:hypothetical protein [Paracoccus sulfuroxidans]TWI37973.1 hypothetical protein IQ24_00106 [Paracoccus sulfuroxidans]
MTIWDGLIWSGSAITVLGLIALGWCILTVIRARRSGASEEALRQTMRRVVAVNMAALCASVLGLMLVVLGIMLGK